MHERHSYRLLRDLLAHKEAIFGELKRNASSYAQNAAATQAAIAARDGGSTTRLRAISTDESNRRANTEARNRAIASRSRAASPAPHVNGRTGGHRRDRSAGPAETRFPIHATSPPSATADGHRRGGRTGLEVPDGTTGSPATGGTDKQNAGAVEQNHYMPSESSQLASVNQSHTQQEQSNGSPDPSSHTPAPMADSGASQQPEKRDSLNRGSKFPARKTGTAGSLGNRSSAGSAMGAGGGRVSLEGERPVGVQLSDRPMDD